MSSLEDLQAGDCRLIRGSFLNTNCSGDRWGVRTQDQGRRLGDVGGRKCSWRFWVAVELSQSRRLSLLLTSGGLGDCEGTQLSTFMAPTQVVSAGSTLVLSIKSAPECPGLHCRPSRLGSPGFHLGTRQ